jgi:AraC-like DNA-binding protein
MPFLHGPFLFIYILALTRPKNIGWKNILVHALLPLVILTLFFPFLSLSVNEKITLFKAKGKGYETTMLISSILLDISGVFYLFLYFKYLHEHKKRILRVFSNQDKINLNWLRLMIFMVLIIWIAIIIIRNDDLIFTLSTIYVIILGYFGIKQVGIFSNNNIQLESEGKLNTFEEDEVIEAIDSLEEKKKYAKSGLRDEDAKILHEKLTNVMGDKKLFKESELTLVELANFLNVHPNYLSQVINEKEGVNFYDYINRLRVEEFKRLSILPTYQKYTIIAIAYECGFNSKSTFNRIFKKYTNLSPSEFLKAQGLNNIDA